MTTIPQQEHGYSDDGMPSRGLLGDLIMLITQPVSFFVALSRKRSAHTLIIAVLILAIMVFNTLQAPTTPSTPDLSGVSGEGIPGEGMPFDPGFPVDNGGGSSSGSDITTQWMTALSQVGAVVLQWFVLAFLLSEVSVFNGRRPQLGKNLQIVVWASVPLALMAILQSIYIAGGGTLTETGFTGFLDEWSRFAEFHIILQGFIYGLASYLNLFWLWSLYLLYLGSRYTLRGNHFVALLLVTTWIVFLGVAQGFLSYDRFQDQMPVIDELVSEEYPMDSEILPDETFLEVTAESEQMP